MASSGWANFTALEDSCGTVTWSSDWACKKAPPILWVGQIEAGFEMLFGMLHKTRMKWVLRCLRVRKDVVVNDAVPISIVVRARALPYDVIHKVGRAKYLIQ
ncbi:hypothetical protein D9M69_451830 [compost metagenome]